jgi:hypothetical protein
MYSSTSIGMSMSTTNSEKFYNIFTIYDNKPIIPELVEKMKQYNAIKIACLWFNQYIDCIPSNIKYIDLSAASYFDKTLNNLPAGLIGLALNETYPADKLTNLPHGLKIIYTTFDVYYSNNIHYRPANVEMMMEVVPPTVEYIAYPKKIHMVNMIHKYVKKVIPNDKHLPKNRSNVIYDYPFQDYGYDI